MNPMRRESDRQVINALEIDEADWDEFVELRGRLRKLALKHIDPSWKNLHTADPQVKLQDCLIVCRFHSPGTNG